MGALISGNITINNKMYTYKQLVITRFSYKRSCRIRKYSCKKKLGNNMGWSESSPVLKLGSIMSVSKRE